MTRRARIAGLGVLAVGLAVAITAIAQAPDVKQTIQQGDKLFEQKNYKEAADQYQKALAAGPAAEQVPGACEKLIACKLRLQLFDDALKAGENYVQRTAGTYHEARAERLTGNLYMLVPHWGTRAGGVFYRAQYKQGIYLQSVQHDKKLAVQHLEHARDLYAKYDQAEAGKDPLPADDRKGWHDERIQCIFDLASTVSRFGIYENNWYYWYAGGERDDERAQTAGEADFDEYQRQWELRRTRPIGLRVGADGNPAFPSKPDKYAADIGDDEKILYLLAEVRDLDKSKEGKYVALSYYRQAMLARARFGMDRISSWCRFY